MLLELKAISSIILGLILDMASVTEILTTGLVNLMMTLFLWNALTVMEQQDMTGLNLITNANIAVSTLPRRTFMYSPKIKVDLVRQLYQLKQQTRTPMTKLVNEAIVEYLIRRNKNESAENQLSKDGSKVSR